MSTRERAPSQATALHRLTAAHNPAAAHDPTAAENLAAANAVVGREGGHVAGMQRRRLLSAFVEVLAERGLEDARVGRVCSRAGVSRRTFYDLFDDREACFLAVVDDALGRISRTVVPAYRGDDHGLNGTSGGVSVRWRGRVRSALSVLLDFFDEEPLLTRVLLVETLKAGPAVCERRRRALDLLTSVVEQGRSESKSGSEPSSLTGQSTVGGAVSVIHARVIEGTPRPLIELLNPLMSMIVHPYLGPRAARKELDHRLPSPKITHEGHAPKQATDPFKDLPIRITFRTARVLVTIGSDPGASNRQIADGAGVADQGQMSKLLTRLEGFELIENHGQGHTKGAANAWQLTQRGHHLLQALTTDNDYKT